MKKYQRFLSENFQFLEMKFSIYLNRPVFVMPCFLLTCFCLASVTLHLRVCPAWVLLTNVLINTSLLGFWVKNSADDIFKYFSYFS